MLRQATIYATKGIKDVRVTVLHDPNDKDFADRFVHIKVNDGQPIEVNADNLAEAIAHVLPKEVSA